MFRWFKVYRKRPLFGIGVVLVFFNLGILLTNLYSEKWIGNHYLHSTNEQTYYLARLEKPPLEKKNSFRFEVRLVLKQDTTASNPIRGKLLLYLEKDSSVQHLRVGDEILFKAYLNKLSPPKNPNEFDYRNYLNLQRIYAQVYLKTENWRVFQKGEGFFIMKMAFSIRQHFLEVVDSWALSKQNKAVTKALLLGYRFEIDGTLLQAYSAAGATHVLAVSGLHVGIVYLMATYLLSFLRFSKHSRALQTIIIVLFLWLYAMITGLSPSVVRAVTMFSFVALGKGFKRNTSIYNTLLASAIFLLLIKPTYLFEVGFQLSYAAVFFIVWLQSGFQSLWTPRFWIGEKIWMISTVSLAAQIGTFPLALYYFHQFPSLFLISNLLVIPIISVLMYLGLTYLVLSALGLSIPWLLKLYAALLDFMNVSVRFIESFSGVLIEQIHISRLELVLLYTLILLFFSWLLFGKRWRLVGGLLFALWILTLQWTENYTLNTTSEAWLYSVKNHMAISIIDRDHFHLIADEELLKDEEALQFHVYHHMWSKNTKNLLKIPVDTLMQNGSLALENGMLQFQRKALWFYSDSIPAPNVDYWLIQSKKDLPPKGDTYLPKAIMLCKETNRYQSEKWKNWAGEHQLKYYNVLDTGAIQLTSF